jgi:RAQPRD family integrative conjugative element protein
MADHSKTKSGRGPQCWTLAGALLIVLSTIHASENSAEREHLATILRQLDMLDRLAAQATEFPQQQGSRYHFDYMRLREDIKHVRSGIQDYLTPERAQPRDPVELNGEYSLESEEDL